ncbi:hypothetical protein AMV190 [Betaentomopoxvirus amoorei]|uniref:AMV190 n=1 Tax=Amsacta moorei entomopoxvirus TaxID=28321 RepID=Q9EML5_AMEPV|nr:hypothetical protein AMV190 [Amsacta moorei entomopoxvirus]AAG02896.1 AMV190 [Amsacta moorei entomopoxvirus]
MNYLHRHNCHKRGVFYSHSIHPYFFFHILFFFHMLHYLHNYFRIRVVHHFLLHNLCYFQTY